MFYAKILEQIEQDKARFTALLAQKDQQLQLQGDRINQLKRKVPALEQDNAAIRAERKN